MGLQNRTPPTAEEYDRWRTEYANWGRWGDDDELGTLNFVTDDVRRAAAALVSRGRVISCARSIDTKPGPANPYPARHMVAMQDSGAMCDHLSLFNHGSTETHLDALCHLPVEEGDQTWNGQRLDRYGMPVEHRGTVDFWRDGIVTRGVLYDIPRLRGTDFVTPGAPVHGWELATAKFRTRTIALVRARWLYITVVTVVSHLSLFLVLLLALRFVGVGADQVSLAEALAVFAFARLLTAIPITPGGLGVVEVALITGLAAAGGDRALVAAAVLVFRALTYVLPIPLGLAAYVFWRRNRSWRRAPGTAPHTELVP